MTRLPCVAQSKYQSVIDMKAPKSKPDKFLMELKHFFPLISYYLPTLELVGNEDLKNWMRNTPNLSY
jgi:hypothetical protein